MIFKRIFLFFLVFIFSYLWVFAQGEITLQSDKNNVWVNDIFSIDIFVLSDKNIWENFSIEWIEKFQQFSRQNSTRISVINGEQKIEKNIKISLNPTAPGRFKIGPVVMDVNGEKISSEAIFIDVWDVSSTKKSSHNSEKKWENNEPKHEQENEKFHGVLGANFSLFDFSYFLLFLVFLSGVLYVVVSKIFDENKKENVTKKEVDKKPEESIFISLMKKLVLLKKNSWVFENSAFYHELNSVFREYLSMIGFVDVHQLTLEEIQKLELDTEVRGLFEQVYMLEFSGRGDDTQLRFKVIHDLECIIKKHI